MGKVITRIVTAGEFYKNPYNPLKNPFRWYKFKRNKYPVAYKYEVKR